MISVLKHRWGTDDLKFGLYDPLKDVYIETYITYSSISQISS